MSRRSRYRERVDPCFTPPPETPSVTERVQARIEELTSELEGLVSTLTPAQRAFLVAMSAIPCPAKGAVALALGLHPNTPGNWKQECPNLARAFELVGLIEIERSGLIELVEMERDFARRCGAMAPASRDVV